MTCKEKFEKEFPNYDYKDYCPDDFRYLGIPDYCKEDAGTRECERCWNREIPEEEDDVAFRQSDEFITTATTTPGYVTVTFPASAPKHDTPPTENINAPVILDSGDRTEFASGAVRDMREGKGRCDLMPLEVVADILASPVIESIKKFLDSGNTNQLYAALHIFAIDCYGKDADYERTSQIEATMLLEVAKHFEDGAKKYGPDNWRRGIPVHCYIDSAVRHYLKWLRGDKDEPHDRAFCWNLMCCIWEVDYHEYGEVYGKIIKEEP